MTRVLYVLILLLLAGCVSPRDEPEIDSSQRQSRDPTLNPILFEHNHLDGSGDAVFPVTVPESADVSIWWNGTTVGSERGTVELISPRGTTVISHEMPANTQGLAIMGRNFPQETQGVTLESGSWTIRFEGQGMFTAYLHLANRTLLDAE